MKRKLPILFALIAMLSFTTNAQTDKSHYDNKPYVEGEMLLQVTADQSIRSIVNKAPFIYKLKIERELSKPMRVWLLEFDHTAVTHEQMQHWLYTQRGVSVADYNYHIQMRATLPGDPSIADQWHHNNTGQTGGTADADIDSDLAWDITTGGQTAYNDDIVVCMLEGTGGNLNHQDLSPNRWSNAGEIDGNGIDDDGNGYIDDKFGWNPGSNNDDTGTGSHGTNCLGMIGAKGNNGLNVVGANWDVKLMVLNMSGGLTQASVIEAYTYPLVQRQRWNNSGGTEGAFVVATSASWGIDGADPSGYPLWCQFYDTLGYYGVLNVGATTNSNLDVDTAGDMPTACNSDYMIGVGRTDHNDNTAGGYGDQTIEFGAPGIDVVTTNGTNGITTTTGTSFSCPLTAGVIGLAYSIPCTDFMDIVISDPKAAADLVLQAMMDGVDVKAQLSTKFITGGRLNAKNTLDNLMAVGCSGTICLAPNSISTSNIAETTADVTFTPNASASATLFFYREAGTTPWIQIMNPVSPVSITSLIGCTEYEIQMQSVCGVDSSGLTSITTFNTTGCGNCIDLAYCTSNATDAVDEWIESFVIDTYTNNSGNDNGYGNFTPTGSISLTTDQAYNFTVTPAWGGTAYDEQTKIWIDLDQSGSFEANELLFDQGAADQLVQTGTITIPVTATSGNTRMRVQMAYVGAGQTVFPDVCGSFQWGEVEDYCVDVIPSVICGMTAVSTVNNPTCLGIDDGSISLVVSGGTPSYTYDWGVNGGDVDNISALSDGSYSVTITDGAACDTTINYSLAYTTVMSSSVNTTDITCNGLTDGTATAFGAGGTSYTYQWVGGPATDVYTGMGAGNFTVEITDVTGCMTQEVITINEPALEQASFTSNATFLSVAFNNTSSAGTYSWDFGDLNTSADMNPTHLYADSGTYTVCLDVTTACGTFQSCNDITIMDDDASIMENAADYISVYPNPATNLVNFKITSANMVKIEIVDVVGKVIVSERINSEITSIDVQHFNNGAYFYKILGEDDSILFTNKIIVSQSK